MTGVDIEVDIYEDHGYEFDCSNCQCNISLPEELRQEMMQVNNQGLKFVLHCEEVLPVLKREWFSENNIEEGIIVADFFKEPDHLNGIYKDNPWKEQFMCKTSCESYIKIERAIVQLVEDEPDCSVTLFPLLMFDKDGSAKTKESSKQKKREAEKRRKMRNNDNNSKAIEPDEEAQHSSAPNSNMNEEIYHSNIGGLRVVSQESKHNICKTEGKDDDGVISIVSNSSKTTKDCKETSVSLAFTPADLAHALPDLDSAAADLDSAPADLASASAASAPAISTPAASAPATPSKRCCSFCGKVILRKKSWCGRCKADSKRFTFEFEKSIYCKEKCSKADWESRHTMIW